MSNTVKPWVFRVLAAITGVGMSAIVGVKADPAHFGAWFPVVAAAQVFLSAWLGKFVREYGAP